MYTFIGFVNEAEQLWLRLQNAKAKAECDRDWARARRLENLCDAAFWRLMRRMSCGKEGIK